MPNPSEDPSNPRNPIAGTKHVTLRDQFAMFALSCLADPEFDGPPRAVATYVYDVAEALLSERQLRIALDRESVDA